jgi:mono/diheme cytochrome c family protein
MRFGFFIFFVTVTLFASENDSFITAEEYAQHLYENPRGIGCIKCHGKRGEGMVISSYKHKGKTKVLKTTEINSLSYEAFRSALQSRRGVMPKYFLTSSETKALFDYLHKEK